MKAKKKQKRSDKVSGTFTGKGIYRDDVFQLAELSISGLAINTGCHE